MGSTVGAPISTDTIGRDRGAPRSWDEERARLGEADTYWLATTGPQGGPHLVPVLAALVKGVLHVAASETSRKARDIARDSRCVIGAGTEGADLVIEGTASRVLDEGRLRLVAEAYAAKYHWLVTVLHGALDGAEGAPTAGPPPYAVYEIKQTTAFAFGTAEPARSTRWRFGTG